MQEGGSHTFGGSPWPGKLASPPLPFPPPLIQRKIARIPCFPSALHKSLPPFLLSWLPPALPLSWHNSGSLPLLHMVVFSCWGGGVLIDSPPCRARLCLVRFSPQNSHALLPPQLSFLSNRLSVLFYFCTSLFFSHRHPTCSCRMAPRPLQNCSRVEQKQTFLKGERQFPGRTSVGFPGSKV